MTESIPLVSFENFLTGDRAAQEEVANQVYEAFSTVGFIYLKDFGIPQSRIEEIFGLAKTFFELPLAEKLKYKLQDPSVNQGYTGDGAEGHNDHKEAYEHRRFINARCPDESELPGFRRTLDDFYKQCLSLAMNVLKCLAMVLKLGDDFFTTITTRADPQLRILHYPPLERSVIESQGHARIMPHTDYGLCTLLFQDSTGGLEVDPYHTGKFTSVPPIPGTVLVNIADLLQRFTNGRVKSTRHRVVSPPAHIFRGEVLPPRYSIPFFVHPDPETLIDPILLYDGEQKLYEPVNAKEYRDWRTARNYRMKGPEGKNFEVEARG
ncbi:hypothetical protein A1O1_04451 [Capronia coronata CBS 617.96]|uniref:Fe2OG dioxygenase domain-containing protein n=1 Tax=Capronia coronata CBS 617.96 TaxID=1182541 RepID=W9ZA16_9EURO|nr:uncharacterized protein A1O1_04451 [Capronia coronata CBS 617.96]EXJ91339.1 hypothetical protein A1O1_04451 [Capronia coronata CBS 617.96]